jgi:hypothetical protein
MKEDTPIVIAVATYATREAAVEDYQVIRAHKSEGELDHLAVTVLTKDENGELQVERHDSSAKHLAWGGALVGGSVMLLAPAAWPIAFATSVGVGGGVTGVGLAGMGGIVGHFWHNIPKEKVRQMSELLENGQSGLIVVAVNKKGTDIRPLFASATNAIVDDSTRGDIEAAFHDAVARSEAAAPIEG